MPVPVDCDTKCSMLRYRSHRPFDPRAHLKDEAQLSLYVFRRAIISFRGCYSTSHDTAPWRFCNNLVAIKEMRLMTRVREIFNISPISILLLQCLLYVQYSVLGSISGKTQSVWTLWGAN